MVSLWSALLNNCDRWPLDNWTDNRPQLDHYHHHHRPNEPYSPPPPPHHHHHFPPHRLQRSQLVRSAHVWYILPAPHGEGTIWQLTAAIITPSILTRRHSYCILTLGSYNHPQYTYLVHKPFGPRIGKHHLGKGGGLRRSIHQQENEVAILKSLLEDRKSSH